MYLTKCFLMYLRKGSRGEQLTVFLNKLLSCDIWLIKSSHHKNNDGWKLCLLHPLPKWWPVKHHQFENFDKMPFPQGWRTFLNVAPSLLFYPFIQNKFPLMKWACRQANLSVILNFVNVSSFEFIFVLFWMVELFLVTKQTYSLQKILSK